MPVSKTRAFTLAELLIALVILGVIATFTIPKVLQSQQNSQWKSQAKEVAGTLSGALSAYQRNTPLDQNTFAYGLTPFINYVRIETATTMDGRQTTANAACTSSTPCYRMHSGGMLRPVYCSFGSTSTTSIISYIYDPDGIDSGTTNGTGKSVQFFIYMNGRITSKGGVLPNSMDGCANTESPDPTQDPPWFSWN